MVSGSHQRWLFAKLTELGESFFLLASSYSEKFLDKSLQPINLPKPLSKYHTTMVQGFSPKNPTRIRSSELLHVLLVFASEKGSCCEFAVRLPPGNVYIFRRRRFKATNAISLGEESSSLLARPHTALHNAPVRNR